MFTEQDKVFIQQAKATADKSAMIDRICRFIYAILAIWSGWLLYSDTNNSGNLMLVFLGFFLIFISYKPSIVFDTTEFNGSRPIAVSDRDMVGYPGKVVSN